MADQPRREILIPWGPHERLDLGWPADWPLPEVSEPDLSGAIGPEGYEAALRAALDVPQGGKRLERLVAPGAKIAIVVDDPSRWTPVRQALPPVLERLHRAGVRPEDVDICFGVGRHNAVQPEAMRQRLGDAVVSSYRTHSPPVDDLRAYDHLGTTRDGIPVRVYAPVARADVRVLIGSVLPHLQAGFGGGWKLVFPGCSHRITLGALHRQGLDGGRTNGHDASRLLGGDIEANPMRQAIRRAAERLPGASFSISHLLGTSSQLLDVATGDPSAVEVLLARQARARFASPGDEADVVVAGNYPWPGDPMQSFKVLLHHRNGCRPDGALVGFFWTDPDEIDRSFPRSSLRRIARTGALGAWTLRRGLALADRVATAAHRPSAFMIRWARELVVDRGVYVYCPELARSVGSRLGPVRLFDGTAELWDSVESDLSGIPAKARVFPQGGLSYIPWNEHS